jgi:hypothetical protein
VSRASRAFKVSRAFRASREFQVNKVLKAILEILDRKGLRALKENRAFRVTTVSLLIKLLLLMDSLVRKRNG